MVSGNGTKAGAAGLVALGVIAGFGLNEGTARVSASAAIQPEGEGDPAAMMEAWAAANMPGEQHAAFESLVGEWDGAMTGYMPDGNTFKTQGLATYKVIMNGRFLSMTWDGDMMGMPFTGNSVMGYSTIDEEYQSVWFDSTSNSMYFYTGEDHEGKIVMWGKEKDPASGMVLKTKDVLTHHGDDKMQFERTYIMPDGNTAPAFEIVYTRR